MSSTPASELRSRNLRTLAALAGLFLVPLLVSFWMYYATDWRPASRVNHGELLAPARPLPRESLPVVLGTSGGHAPFSRNWSIVYIGHGNCDDSCRSSLYAMRQTRLGLNNDTSRIDRVFLVTADCCNRRFLSTEHSGMLVLDASGAGAAALLSVFPEAEREHSLFIVDPLGNLMMRFDTRQNPKGLLQDLQQLLRLSHIG